jgi:hypothetical protein
MLRARQLTAAGEKLLAQVDQLLDQNSRALADNPVRTVRELLRASEEPSGIRATESAVDAFLAQLPVSRNMAAQEQDTAYGREAEESNCDRSQLSLEDEAAEVQPHLDGNRGVTVEATHQGENTSVSHEPLVADVEAASEQVNQVQQSTKKKRVQASRVQRTTKSVQQESISEPAKPIFQQF